jgi:hypothetical protein
MRCRAVFDLRKRAAAVAWSGLLGAAVLFGVTPYAQADDSAAVVFIRVKIGNDVRSQGTGFLISKNGYILTARHVVEAAIGAAAARIEVSLKSKGAYPVAATIFQDCGPTVPDICMIKIGEQEVAREGITSVPELACRNVSLREKISTMGYPLGEDNTMFDVPGQVVGGLGEGFLFPAALPIAQGMSGGPVFDDSRYVVGVLRGVARGTPHTYFTPIAQASSKLAAAGVPCPYDPPRRRGEILVPFISGGAEVRTAAFALREAFNEMARDWSGVDLPDIPRPTDEFLDDLSEKLLSDTPLSPRLQNERFKKADAVDWLKHHNARVLYPVLVRLYAGPGSSVPDRARVAFGRVDYDGENATVDFKVKHIAIGSQWNPYVGARKAMETLAVWRKDKFVKKAFVALCINFEGYGQNLWAKRTPLEFPETILSHWQSHPDLKWYKIVPMSEEDCNKIYDISDQPDNQWKRPSNYQNRLREQKGKLFPEYFIEADILKDRGTYITLGKIENAAGARVSLDDGRIRVEDKTSWKNFASRIGAGIQLKWDTIKNMKNLTP